MHQWLNSVLLSSRCAAVRTVCDEVTALLRRFCYVDVQEVVSVLWSLVRLRTIRHLKLRHTDSKLRDALVEQYQRHLRQTALQLQQLTARRFHAGMQQQQQDGLEVWQQELQQQTQAVLQQLPVFTHAAVLLAGARLGLSANQQLQVGTSKLISKVSVACASCKTFVIVAVQVGIQYFACMFVSPACHHSPLTPTACMCIPYLCLPMPAAAYAPPLRAVCGCCMVVAFRTWT